VEEDVEPWPDPDAPAEFGSSLDDQPLYPLPVPQASPVGVPPTGSTGTAASRADLEITLDGTVVAVLGDVPGADA
jgi:hypothetical protein